MIKLERYFTPMIMNPVNVQILTDEYKANGTSVWHLDDLKKALLEISHHKCAYCECDLSEESKYMEVEHFEDKSSNPDKVMEWENLLPSCKRCNVSKGTHNVRLEPIVDPFREDPKAHLKLRLYRFRGKSQIGENTISVVDLNNYERAVMKRFEIGEAIQTSIGDAIEKLERFIDNGSTRSKNRLLGHVQSLLQECQQTSPYSATSASVLHSEKEYYELRDKMILNKLWNDDFECLHHLSEKLSMECA